MKNFELAFLIACIAALGTWIFSEKYEAHAVLAVMGLLAVASIHILWTQEEKIYRIFASISLTVLSATVGIVLLRLLGLNG